MKPKGLNLGGVGLKLKRALNPITSHHVIITFVLVIGALIYAVFTVNNALTMPADQAYITQQETEGVKTRFDEQTIKQIDSLRRSDDGTALTLPGGRINPFTQ